MPSVVIPAFNEQAVIGRCLSALVQDAGDAAEDELEVIVVCNGCKDNTAAMARRYGDRVRVIETPIGSKIHALNLGDDAATRFPRFYVDADVVLHVKAVRQITARLLGGKLAAAPRAKIDFEGCSWAVRAFYEIHCLLPFAREGIGGSGVYALSEAGRARFGRFPNVIADDGYVRVQFTTQERETVTDCVSTVFAPRILKELVRIKTRSHLGTIELRRLLPANWHTSSGAHNGKALLRLFRRIQLWPKLSVYLYVRIAARVLAHRKYRRGNWAWERDESSRFGAVDLQSSKLGRFQDWFVTSSQDSPTPAPAIQCTDSADQNVAST